MSNLKNVRDFGDDDLPERVRIKVQELVAKGYERRALVFTKDGLVFLDKELAENRAFDETFYDERKVDD